MHMYMCTCMVWVFQELVGPVGGVLLLGIMHLLGTKGDPNFDTSQKIARTPTKNAAGPSRNCVGVSW